MYDFNYLGRTFQVLAQGDEAFRQTPEDITRFKARNSSGEMVPLGSVATLNDQTAPYRVPRYNLYPAADVMGAAAPGVSSGTAMTRMADLAKQVLPPGIPIDILAQIGFVVLVGLAAKNAILIVEFARQQQDQEGDAPEEAATAAARTRLRPILMTSFAFILGVFPLAVAAGAGSEM